MPSRLFKEGVYKILITMEQYEVKTTWALRGGKLFRAGEYVLGHILPPGETIRGGGGVDILLHRRYTRLHVVVIISDDHA